MRNSVSVMLISRLFHGAGAQQGEVRRSLSTFCISAAALPARSIRS